MPHPKVHSGNAATRGHRGVWKSLTVEKRRPDRIRNSPHAPWLAVATVCIGAFMGQLDASIVTLAFPALRHTFGSPLIAVQWVGQAYLLVLIALLVTAGRFADMVGRKLVYTYGFVLFVVGSALCGFAPSLGTLIAFRLVQGLGAAMFQANSVAIVAGAVTKDQLGRAIGVQGAAQALGLALGPAVGGLLIAAGGWRLIFFVNVPIGAVGITLAALLIPRSTLLAQRTRFDWAGLAAFTPAICCLLLAVSSGPRHGWGSPQVLALFAAAVVLAAVFVAHEHRVTGPLLELRCFRRIAFSSGVASGLLSYLVLFGTLTVVPFYLESARHEPASTAGLELLVLPLGLGIAAPVAGRLTNRFGSRPLTVGGMTTTAAALIGTLTTSGSTPALLAFLLLAGIGLGTFTPPNNAAIMQAAPVALGGLAGGVLNTTRGLGTSFGLATAGAAYTAGAAGLGGIAAATKGFHTTVLILSATAGAAAVIAGLRGARTPAPRGAPDAL